MWSQRSQSTNSGKRWQWSPRLYYINISVTMPSRVVAPLMLCVGPWFTSLSVFGMISSLRTGKYRASFFTGADLDNDWYLDTYGFLPPAHGYHHPFARWWSLFTSKHHTSSPALPWTFVVGGAVVIGKPRAVVRSLPILA